MPTIEELNARSAGRLPALIGLEITRAEPGRAAGRLPIRPDLLAPNGYLHAASIIALADTCCGFGAVASLPEGARGFTTIELKSNFLGTARGGTVTAVATNVHAGRTTQVWDAVVRDAGSGKTMALFRCTQSVLQPR